MPWKGGRNNGAIHLLQFFTGHIIGGLSNNSANISLNNHVTCARARLSHIYQSKYTQRLNGQRNSLKSLRHQDAVAQNERGHKMIKDTTTDRHLD